MGHRSIYHEPETGVEWYISKVGRGRWRAMRAGAALPIYRATHEQIIRAINESAAMEDVDPPQ